MPNILKINKVEDYCRWLGADCPHPLICAINFAEISPIRVSLNSYGVYGMFFQYNNPFELVYGCGHYDHTDGSVICVAPGQIGGKEYEGGESIIGGWALLFHPDLLRGTQLEKRIRRCAFFRYSVNEALHTNCEEYSLIESLLRLISNELRGPRDAEQTHIIIGYLNLLLRYCERFYRRQFEAEEKESSDLLSEFHDFVESWFESGRQLSDGIPTVQACAEKMCMSPNYFSDTFKRLTGESPGRYIRDFVIRAAKEKLVSGKSVAETAFELGFEYPQHLTRMFKVNTGVTPTQYLASLRK